MVRQGSNSNGDTPCDETERGDTFSRLANTTRLEILQTLASSETPLSYSEVFQEVSVADRGKLNYHLRQLVAEYVHKSDEGYELTQSGKRAANLLATSSLRDGAKRSFQRIDSQCGVCGSDSVELGYRDGEAIVRCLNCDRQLTNFDFPPAAATAYSIEEFKDAFAQRTWTYFDLADEGICPFCAHSITFEIRPSAATDSDSVPAVGTCSECPAGIRAPVGLLLSTRPRIQSALSDSQEKISRIPFWELEWCTFGSSEIQRTDPLVVELEIEMDDLYLSVEVDSDLTIKRLHPVPTSSQPNESGS
ncbi:winged helix-turn-helix domain-containing protein [Saliphagus infecundisoli]|uniref:winged helix-turn-helix domain-containing protein n=1 Tax=Saliphagus infecundisoli TaxID=1849069 RepID=UPI003CCCF431